MKEVSQGYLRCYLWDLCLKNIHQIKHSSQLLGGASFLYSTRARDRWGGNPCQPSSPTLFPQTRGFRHRRAPSYSLWSRSSGSSCLQAWFPLRTTREGSALSLSPRLIRGHLPSLHIHSISVPVLSLLFLRTLSHRIRVCTQGLILTYKNVDQKCHLPYQ